MKSVKKMKRLWPNPAPSLSHYTNHELCLVLLQGDFFYTKYYMKIKLKQDVRKGE